MAGQQHHSHEKPMLSDQLVEPIPHSCRYDTQGLGCQPEWIEACTFRKVTGMWYLLRQISHFNLSQPHGVFVARYIAKPTNCSRTWVLHNIGNYHTIISVRSWSQTFDTTHTMEGDMPIKGLDVVISIVTNELDKCCFINKSRRGSKESWPLEYHCLFVCAA